MPQSNQERGPQAESDRRFPLWTILPWTLLAAALLLLLPRVFHSSQASAPIAIAAQSPHAALRPPSASSQAPNTVPPAESVPAAMTPTKAPAGNTSPTPSAAPVPIRAAPTPLTVTLYSANSGKHVPVGKPVMISAYASLPPGQSATLAISYAKDAGPRTLLSLAQGSLSSAAWTPVEPGRYKFTASALDSRKNGVFSHSLVILVNAPPQPNSAPVASVPAAAFAPPAPIRVAARPSAVRLAAPKHPAPKLSKLTPATPKPPRKAPAPPHISPYHVAAAGFRVRAIAETLAGALRRRGFNAFVRPTAQGQSPKAYQVETGDYMHLDEAQAQVSLLKRDGYPAFLFRPH